jgi:hypothetical protein
MCCHLEFLNTSGWFPPDVTVLVVTTTQFGCSVVTSFNYLQQVAWESSRHSRVTAQLFPVLIFLQPDRVNVLMPENSLPMTGFGAK